MFSQLQQKNKLMEMIDMVISLIECIYSDNIDQNSTLYLINMQLWFDNWKSFLIKNRKLKV